MLQALAQHLCFTVLRRLVVEIEHFADIAWCLCRLSLLLRVRLSKALSLQGLPIRICLMCLRSLFIATLMRCCAAVMMVTTCTAICIIVRLLV